ACGTSTGRSRTRPATSRHATSSWATPAATWRAYTGSEYPTSVCVPSPITSGSGSSALRPPRTAAARRPGSRRSQSRPGPSVGTRGHVLVWSAGEGVKYKYPAAFRRSAEVVSCGPASVVSVPETDMSDADLNALKFLQQQRRMYARAVLHRLHDEDRLAADP